MKLLLALVLGVMSFTVMASEDYECEFAGPNYILSFHQNDTITLSNNLKNYKCKKGRVNLPGTEAELSVLNCLSKNEKVMFYINENAEGDIVLGRDFIFSKDILCKKK